VALGADASVWFACVLDGRAARIVVDERSNIQDSSLLLARGGPIVIGPGVTVGHNVRMGACTVGEDCLIGMGCEIEDGVTVERGACVAARAYVEAGTVVKAGYIWAGRPAREFRPLRDQEREHFRIGRDVYVGYSRTYRSRGS
jgi:carbonic anhydrase/acetyltransferase-like protein (isoleucine patch superfamily)